MATDIAREAAIDRLGNEIDSDIQHDPDDTPARLSSNADQYVMVYSMLNGEPKRVLKIDQRRVLGKMLPNGQPAHWAEGMPGEAPPYVKGKVMCMLHPDFDEEEGASGFARVYVDFIGLDGRTCNMMAPDKNNIDSFKSVYDRDDHMAKKHPREWETIQAALEKDREEMELRERRLDRAATKQQGEALMAMAASRSVQPSLEEEVIHFICDIEGCGSELDTDVGLVRHKRTTMDAAHVQARAEAE